MIGRVIERQGNSGVLKACMGGRTLVLGSCAAFLSVALIPNMATAQDHMAGRWLFTDFGSAAPPAEEAARLCQETFEQHYEDGTFIAFETDETGQLEIVLVGTCSFSDVEVTCEYRGDNYDGVISETYVDRVKRIDDNTVSISVLTEAGTPDQEASWTYHRCVGG